jgi:hypothetical protein
MTDPDSGEPAATALADWATARAREQEEDAAVAAGLRAQLLPLARAAGALRIETRYEGGSDSGMLEGATAEPPEADARLREILVDGVDKVWDAEARAYVERPTKVPFFTAIEALFGHALMARVGNWWDGDIETSGEIVWHVGDDPDVINGEHTLVRRESEWTEWSTADDEADEAAGEGD